MKILLRIIHWIGSTPISIIFTTWANAAMRVCRRTKCYVGCYFLTSCRFIATSHKLLGQYHVCTKQLHYGEHSLALFSDNKYYIIGTQSTVHAQMMKAPYRHHLAKWKRRKWFVSTSYCKKKTIQFPGKVSKKHFCHAGCFKLSKLITVNSKINMPFENAQLGE
jgi:hypothetical protein